ncbi:MAG TPA: excinuclease ABC subunit UvrB [Patescibacteria group bacterium]|nr:excinuclease ABC subunit UvrB [Patescibacteria group bacterium]
MFKLTSSFSPIQEQQKAIAGLVTGIRTGLKNQVLLGVTGSGKTFTVARTIEELAAPALIISHNKTLAGQLYQEMREFFPTNAVSYFVSYYDYYQPEAYIPHTDTYIEKEAQINQLIDKLRLASTTNILTRKDVIVVASVSCIYNIGSPHEYGKFILELKKGEYINRTEIFRRLAQLHYERSEFDFKRGTFRQRGGVIDIYPAYEEVGIRVELENEHITAITQFNPITGEEHTQRPIQKIVIYPAKHYMTDQEIVKKAEAQIRKDLEIEYKNLQKRGKIIEAERLYKKVTFDLEMIKEVGYVNGIENYSRYFEERKIGDPPYTLINYFNETYGNDWTVYIDESHMTIPQIRGMYNGDYQRKKTLIEYGFRLKSALDNRPLKFEEFLRQVPRLVYISATPNDWEMRKSKTSKIPPGIVQQLVRPTGIVDPHIVIKPARGEVLDLISEIKKRVEKKERVLVTTLTKRTAEDLTHYLTEKHVRVQYLHSDIKTLERTDILHKLRKNDYDALVGINLLREGLDLPEVSLVAILDADREGFLRSKTSLIQIMGRAARNTRGEVILYADVMTRSIKEAVSEVDRRREYQIAYNKTHGITPSNIIKPIQAPIISEEVVKEAISSDPFSDIKSDSLTPFDKKRLINTLRKEMKRYANDLKFEAAIAMREKIKSLT